MQRLPHHAQFRAAAVEHVTHQRMTQVREVNALTHVENELIDEALGRVMTRVAERGWGGDLDVVCTTGHGEFQGDFGMLFKGPYHVDALMRVPLIWRPALGNSPPGTAPEGRPAPASVVTPKQ